MYTKEEKELAKALVENKPYMALLAKIMLEKEDKINSDIILTKTNEQLGEMVRADDLAEQKIANRFNILKNLGTSFGKKPVPTARE